MATGVVMAKGSGGWPAWTEIRDKFGSCEPFFAQFSDPYSLNFKDPDSTLNEKKHTLYMLKLQSREVVLGLHQGGK